MAESPLRTRACARWLSRSRDVRFPLAVLTKLDESTRWWLDNVELNAFSIHPLVGARLKHVDPVTGAETGHGATFPQAIVWLGPRRDPRKPPARLPFVLGRDPWRIRPCYPRELDEAVRDLHQAFSTAR